MRVAVNATSLRSAGGRSVGLNVVSALGEIKGGLEIIVYVPPNVGYEELGRDHIEVQPIPSVLDRSWLSPVVDQIWLPRAVKKYSPDVVFNLGNMAIPVSEPQLVVLMWPYAIYPESEVWSRMSVRDWIQRRVRRNYFEWNVRHAAVVATQTERARDRFRKLFEFEGEVVVVPCAVSFEFDSGVDIDWGERLGVRKHAGEKVLLCLSRYYPHKNFEILLSVARKVKSDGLSFRIITTVEAGQHPGAERFLRVIEEEGLEEVIWNVGQVPREAVRSLYDSVDGLILPTLLESFSQTYIEAMHVGVPVFTSDLDFARTVCQDSAYYFDPNDASRILEVLKAGYADGERLARKLERGREIAKQNPSWHEVTEEYLGILRNLYGGEH